MKSGKQTIRKLLSSGKLQRAFDSADSYCKENPADAEAWFLLGGVCSELGDINRVVDCCRRVIQLQPDNIPARFNLGVALQTVGRPVAAAAAYQEVLRREPGQFQTQANLGLVLRGQGRLDEAENHCRGALATRPGYAPALNNLGLVYMDKADCMRALDCFRQAVHADPQLADAYYNMSICYRRQNVAELAESSVRKALKIQPGFPMAWNELGSILQSRGETRDAMRCYRRAIDLQSDYAEAYNNLAISRQEAGQLTEAVAQFKTAIALRDDYVQAYSNLGNALVFLGHIDAALENYETAIRLDPEYAQAHWNRSWALLLKGDFEQGLKEYEWRWKCDESKVRTYPQPVWDGAALDGRTILLHAEQGAGDTIQFIRYAPLVKQYGGTVLVMCEASLVELLRTCPGVDAVFDEESALPDFDVHVAIPSLPGILNTRLDTIPGGVPYLQAPCHTGRGWLSVIALDTSALKVGIIWSGNPQFRFNRYRSCTPQDFMSLAAIEGVRLYSLQVGAGNSTGDIPGAAGIEDISMYLNDFSDTAAAISVLDLIITVDTGVAHLAGALGAPVWVLLSFAPDWRWLLERSDSPWYSTMKLFRQKELAKWDDVFLRVRNELQQLLDKQNE